MAIIEIHGGPIRHRYLMKKSKDELASMYMRLLRDTEQYAKDAERYRWMKQQRKASLLNIFDPNGAHDYDQTDAVIDAAIQGANTDYTVSLVRTFPPKPKAVFHHPAGIELWDRIHMDMHALAYAEPLLKEIERLRSAMVKAEAALADIGDADREPGDDVAWCERRAAQALPEVRAALSVTANT